MARVIEHSWKNSKNSADPAPVVLALDNGRFHITADASTDADGAPDALQIDPDGNKQTSLGKENGWRGEGDYVNARSIPYFVLPKNWKAVTNVACKLGDVAKLTYNENTVFAIYADAGPDKSIGEASIAAVEALGFNPWNNARTKIISGIPHGVTYEIIPGSANLKLCRSFEEIQAYGKECFGE